jgi:transmembrane 9 superfamily protein 2/4
LHKNQQNQEFVRPGFELGYKEDGKFYVFNHLQFNILVHPTHGEYMRARQGFKDAAVLDNIDARRMLLTKKQLLAAGASEAALGGSSSSSSGMMGRQLAADDKAAAGEGACGCDSRWVLMTPCT